jgi:hypothetical protein
VLALNGITPLHIRYTRSADGIMMIAKFHMTTLTPALGQPCALVVSTQFDTTYLCHFDITHLCHREKRSDEAIPGKMHTGQVIALSHQQQQSAV